MSNHNQDPTKQPDLNRKYSRRAKVAGLLSGILPISGAAIAEGIAAQPASAHSETAAQVETQNPQAYLASTDKKLVALRNKMASAHHVQTIPSKNNSPSLNKGLEQDFPGDTTYLLSMPSAKEKGHYDQLVMLVDKYGNPLILTLNRNINSSRMTDKFLMAGTGTGIRFQQADENFNFTPTSAFLNVVSVPGGPWMTYSIGPASTPSTEAIDYQKKPATVSQQVNYLLAQSEVVLEHHI